MTREPVTCAAMWLLPVWLFVTPAAVAQGLCGSLPDVLRVGFNETEISSTVSEARDLYRWACSEEATSTGGSTGAEARASWGLFGGGVKRGSSSFEDYRQKNCHLSEDTVANYVASSFRQRTIDPALMDAWRTCVASRGIELRPSVFMEQTRVNFTLQSVRNPPATLRGIRSQYFTCETQAGSIAENGIDGESVEIPRDEALNVFCLRSSEEQTLGVSAATVYPGDVLSLDLSTGAHDMEFVERRVGSVAEEFTELQARVRSLETRALQVEVHVQVGDIAMQAAREGVPYGLPRLVDGVDDNDARIVSDLLSREGERGIVNGRVNFQALLKRVWVG